MSGVGHWDWSCEMSRDLSKGQRKSHGMSRDLSGVSEDYTSQRDGIEQDTTCDLEDV